MAYERRTIQLHREVVFGFRSKRCWWNVKQTDDHTWEGDFHGDQVPRTTWTVTSEAEVWAKVHEEYTHFEATVIAKFSQ